MSNVLTEIVQHKKVEVAQRQQQRPLNKMIPQLSKSNRSLLEALSSNHSDFILECKKASPSKGLIRKNFDLAEIIGQYKDYASAVSVLTDHKYFQGDFDFLKQASQSLTVPILCKDFFLEEYQVYEARYHGADAILLMLSVLDNERYTELAKVAESLSLDILTEVHNEEELARAIELDARIIGINNRNLKDLSIDLATTEKLASKIPAGHIIISESGIATHQDVNRLSPLVNGFLIGSSIMAEDDIRSACKSLIFGRVKICGITRAKDAITIDQQGAVYGGFIFYPDSPRYITASDANAVSKAAPLRYVGVFVNADISLLVDYAVSLNLYAVQLHGDEDDHYIAQLKKALPNTKIWKALRVNERIEVNINPMVDHYLLDTYSNENYGGTGTAFDWDLLENIDADKLILAGGINAENVQQAIDKNTYAIDLSSGVELKPGVKCSKKLKQVFQQLRAN